MATLTSYETGQDEDQFLGDSGGTEFRKAQSFQLSALSTVQTADLYLTDGPSSPTDDITVRIETDDGSGFPSGTLVDANATGTISAASVTGSYQFLTCTFSGEFVLSATTTYHLVASVPNQSNDVRFHWGVDNGGSYASGKAMSSSDGGAWSDTGAGNYDLLFKISGFVGLTEGSTEGSYAFLM